jgi:hypothetical protein
LGRLYMLMKTSNLSEGLRPPDPPAPSLARRFAGSLRSGGSLAALARVSRRGVQRE